MVAFVSTGANLAWSGYSLKPTSITADSGDPEVAEIPYLYDFKGAPPRVVPTGDYTGGSITVEYNHDKSSGPASIFGYIGTSAALTYSDEHGHQIVMNNALLVGASENVAVGSVVSITLEFRWTSFLGNNY